MTTNTHTLHWWNGVSFAVKVPGLCRMLVLRNTTTQSCRAVNLHVWVPTAMKNRLLSLLLVMMLFYSCKGQSLLINTKVTQFGTFKFSNVDTEVVSDLIKSCHDNLQPIAITLKVKIDPNVVIEVYPDQEDYDQDIINPNLKGSPAISGNRRIQMVSPLCKIKIDTFSYSERLLFLIHEYVHIFIDQIEPSPPIYLDEGLACYYGSYSFYKSISDKYRDQLNFKPTISQLTNYYDKIPASDVFSFLFIDFLIKNEGQQSLSTLIRNPGILKTKEIEWLKYLVDYHDNK